VSSARSAPFIRTSTGCYVASLWRHLPSFCYCAAGPGDVHSFPTRRSSDLGGAAPSPPVRDRLYGRLRRRVGRPYPTGDEDDRKRSEEHTSELQSRVDLVCRLLLEKKTISDTEHRVRMCRPTPRYDTMRRSV